MGVPWPSRSHLRSDLAQTFHAGQLSQCRVSCGTAHGAQVRLTRLTCRALSITAQNGGVKELQPDSSSGSRGSAERYMGDAGPGGGGNERPGVESAAAWSLRAWGAGLAS